MATQETSQETLLDEARQQVAKQQFLMQRKLDDQNLQDALRYAIQMIFELKTAKLSPAKYYELYMQVMHALHDLTVYIEDEATRDKSPAQTKAYLNFYYEYVQYSGNIIPRLYLLNCVGGVCLKLETDEEKRMDIMKDMMDMNKGVQHPTRGLFLRNYLSQVCREHLPDVESEQEEPSEAVKTGIDFVLRNFSEMTRLWVRMQHQGAVRDRSRRERERKELRMLVGTTLRRVCDLTAVTKERYQEEVFPVLRKTIVECKDKIAQEYLMDCIIHVFSDEYHLATLDEFLGTCTKLAKDVDVKSIIIALMDRLAKFASDSPALFRETDVFPVFQEQCATLVQKRKKMSLKDKLELQVSLVNFATKCYPEEHGYVIGVWETCLKLLRKIEAKGKLEKLEDPIVREHLVDLLTKPVQSMRLAALEFEEYTNLMQMLGFEKQRQASTQIARHLVNTKAIVDSSESVNKLFEVLNTILMDQPETPEVSLENQFMFDEEQYLICNLVGQIESEDQDEHFECIGVARKFFAKGGEARQAYTFPCLFYNCLQLIRRVNMDPKEEPTYNLKKMFKFINQILTAYGEINTSKVIFMYLDATLAADECGYDTAVYGFVEAAFEHYEDLGDTKEQQRVMQSMTGTLLSIESLDEDNYNNLRQNTVRLCNGLLKKPYQSRAVAKAAHLFWNCKNEEWRDAKVVSKCLMKACKIANNIMQEVTKATVYISILNEFIYFFKSGVEIDDGLQKISQVGSICRQLLEEIDEDETGKTEAENYYRNTLRYVEEKQNDDSNPEEQDLFAQIDLE